MGNSWESAQQMAPHTERTKAGTTHGVKARTCAQQQRFVELQGLLGSRGRGAWGVQGEGGVWAGSSFGSESPFGGQVGWGGEGRGTEGEHAGCAGSAATLELRRTQRLLSR